MRLHLSAPDPQPTLASRLSLCPPHLLWTTDPGGPSRATPQIPPCSPAWELPALPSHLPLSPSSRDGRWPPESFSGFARCLVPYPRLAWSLTQCFIRNQKPSFFFINYCFMGRHGRNIPQWCLTLFADWQRILPGLGMQVVGLQGCPERGGHHGALWGA